MERKNFVGGVRWEMIVGHLGRCESGHLYSHE